MQSLLCTKEYGDMSYLREYGCVHAVWDNSLAICHCSVSTPMTILLLFCNGIKEAIDNFFINTFI